MYDLQSITTVKDPNPDINKMQCILFVTFTLKTIHIWALITIKQQPPELKCESNAEVPKTALGAGSIDSVSIDIHVNMPQFYNRNKCVNRLVQKKKNHHPAPVYKIFCMTVSLIRHCQDPPHRFNNPMGDMT